MSWIDILNYNCSIVGEFLKVRLKSQIIMYRFHIGRKDFAALSIGGARELVAASDAHSAI